MAEQWQCITIALGSVPSEINVPSVRGTSDPAPPLDAMLAASRADVGSGLPLRNKRSLFV